MPCTDAQRLTNRANARHSTGPRSPEGKAISRLNAYRHGMAGTGDVMGPGDDAQLVADRSREFVAELRATDPVSRVLAHRAALLSVRMEQAADRELTAIAVHVADARLQFDLDRDGRLTNLITNLETADDPRDALDDLAGSPAGVAHLAKAWRDLRSAVAADDPAASGRARRWLNLTETNVATTDDLGARIDTEIARLDRLASSIPHWNQAIATARHEAGTLAWFDPGDEATLARRYEAAAERGMYRALRAIAELRRDRDRDRDRAHDLNSVIPPVAAAVHQPASIPRPPSVDRVTPAALGSFRAERMATELSLIQTLAGLEKPPIPAQLRPKTRPDLRKLAKNRR